MINRYDDVIIGAGIVGLAHAYHLGRLGRRVLVLERHPRAMSASVRNFGMLWPIGQPEGSMLNMASRSLFHWRKVIADSGVWSDDSGSLHLAYHDDEAAVLREFASEISDGCRKCSLVEPSKIGNYSDYVITDGIKLAMHSSTEICVDPREVLRVVPEWLSRVYDVTFRYDCAATALCPPMVVAGGREWLAGHVWVCCGDEFQALLVDEFVDSGLSQCKLQMMRTIPMEENCRLGPMLAGGLTLRHYKSFERCPTLPALKARFLRSFLEYEKFGIHVMASQYGAGEIIIGDSHEYGSSVTPFNKAKIDDLILSYLKTFMRLPEIQIGERWFGTYAKHPTDNFFVRHVLGNTTIVTGLGGAGMTLSFGLAEKCVQETI
jgi:FAD dependent oxidoreductase TIGR03364